MYLPNTNSFVGSKTQTILANVKNYKELTSANIRACILAEELRQTSATINAIRPGRRTNTCNWYGGAGHWERDCCKRLRGLSKEEAQSERRWIAVNKKEEAEAAKRNTPSVSATAQETPSDSSSGSSISPSSVTVAFASINSVTFYIAHESQWMLDSTVNSKKYSNPEK